MCAAADVLEGLASSQTILPQVHHDVVALVKSLYLMLHPSAQEEASRRLEKSSKSTIVAVVRSFWAREFSVDTAAGRLWVGFIDTATSCSILDAENYNTNLGMLSQGISAMLRARSTSRRTGGKDYHPVWFGWVLTPLRA